MKPRGARSGKENKLLAGPARGCQPVSEAARRVAPQGRDAYLSVNPFFIPRAVSPS
jgi:hypothetical protein